MHRNDEQTMHGNLLDVYTILVALEEPVSAQALACASGISRIASLLNDELIPLGVVRRVDEGPEAPYYQAIGEPAVAFDADAIRKDAVTQLLLSDDPSFRPLTVEICLRLNERKKLFNFGVVDGLYYRLAAACLAVGRTAVPDFVRAAQRLNMGVQSITAVSGSYWNEQYELSLALFSAAAEVNHGCSQYGAASDCIEEVKLHAKCVLDTITARATEVHVAGFQGNKDKAVTIGLEVLSKLGYRVPLKPLRLEVYMCYNRLSFLLFAKTTSRIIHSQEMTNQKALAAMKMLHMVFSYSFIAHPRLTALVCLMMVRLTLRFGLSVMSAPAFGMYGILLSRYDRDEDSKFFSQLALDVCRRYGSKEWLPRTYVSVYGRMDSSLSVDSALEPLFEAYSTALSSGDAEFCYIAAHLYFFQKFASGGYLKELQEEIQRMHKEATNKYNTWRSIMMEVPLLLIQHFTDQSPNIDTRANILNAARPETVSLISQNPALAGFVNSLQIFLAFVLGDYQFAYSASQCAMDNTKLQFAHPMMPSVTMARGLSFAANHLRTGKGRKAAIRELKVCKASVQTAAYRQPAIASAKVFILQGELAWLEKKPKEAFFFYSNACSCDSPIMDRAIAHERLSLFLAVERKDMIGARKKLLEAKQLYSRWGATAKAASLLQDTAGYHT